MNLIEAARKGGKITGSVVKKRGDEYWYFGKSGDLYDQDGHPMVITKERILADDYEPYEPQIVPDKENEVWLDETNNQVYGTFFNGRGISFRRIMDGSTSIPIENIIHGQNGWTRLYPEVPDPNIEKVVIQNVKELPVMLLNALRLMDERGRSSIRVSRALFESEWEELRQLIFTSLEMSENIRDTMDSKSTGTSHE